MKRITLYVIILFSSILRSQNNSFNTEIIEEFKKQIDLPQHITIDSVIKKQKNEFIQDLDSLISIEKYILYYSCGDLTGALSFGKYNNEIYFSLQGYIIYDFIKKNIDTNNLPNLKLIKEKTDYLERFHLKQKARENFSVQIEKQLVIGLDETPPIDVEVIEKLNNKAVFSFFSNDE
jgi:hypothetical protein